MSASGSRACKVGKRRHWRQRRLVARIVGGAVSLVCALSAPAKLEAAEQCWSREELADAPGERIVRKDVAAAYRPLPQSAATAHPSAYPALGGKVLRRVDLPPGVKRVAFTFDLCEQPFEISGYQGDIFEFLRENSVPATIFAGGKWLVTHPERAQQILGDPLFEIGNHAWEHRNLRVASPEARLSEIDGAVASYAATYRNLKQRSCLARDGRPASEVAASRQSLFRFPFGACTAAAIADVESRGLLAVQWDVSSSDPWPGLTVDAMIANVSKQVRPGSIVLFHANGRGFKTAQALPALVQRLRAQGYQFVTVSQLLATPGAKPVTSTECYDFRPKDVERYDELSRNIEKKAKAFYAKFETSSSAAPETTSPAADKTRTVPEEAAGGWLTIVKPNAVAPPVAKAAKRKGTSPVPPQLRQKPTLSKHQAAPQVPK